ncbi:MAG: hypothetical protein JWR02_2579 [Mucilaginibacter sp.]|nr:hypothetical protein [Mucilaginibacter sp.]
MPDSQWGQPIDLHLSLKTAEFELEIYTYLLFIQPAASRSKEK